MTSGSAQDPQEQPGGDPAAPKTAALRMPLPGVAAIAFYLLLMAGSLVFGAVKGEIPKLYLLFSVAFITASAGLIASFRWAWSLALATVFVLAAYWAWAFSHVRSGQSAVLGLFNLFFFLYLIRPEVRARLR